jgi:hypothetical protein
VDGKPVLAIVLEVQLSEAARKRFTWPAYGAVLRSRFECDVVVLVVTPDASVARWASEPIRTGPGSVFTPLVVGPEAVPVVTDSGQAAAEPELAILSVMAHGQGEVERAVKIALAASEATQGLEEEQGLLYYGLIRAALSEAARKAFQMLPQGRRFFDEEQQKTFDRGRAEGEARGRAAAVLAVLAVLEARHIAVTTGQRDRIERCGDLSVLDLWLRKAATVADARELFE